FQAEDGIRDFHVTGVQTCALPICRRPREQRRHLRASGVRPPIPRRATPRDGAQLLRRAAYGRSAAAELPRTPQRHDRQRALAARSEERRVGKEWTSGGEPCVTTRA